MAYQPLRVTAAKAALRRSQEALRQRFMPDEQKKEDEKPTLKGGTSSAKVRDAIRKHLPIQFYYRNQTDGFTGTRSAVPFAIYRKDGKLYLYAYLIRPTATSSRGRLGWRTFILSRVTAVRLPPGRPEVIKAIGARNRPGWRAGSYGSGSVVRPPTPQK